VSFEALVHHTQLEELCVSAAATDQISRGRGLARSVNTLQNPVAAAGVVEMYLTPVAVQQSFRI